MAHIELFKTTHDRLHEHSKRLAFISLVEVLENKDHYTPRHAGGLEPASLSAPDTHLPNTMPITHNEWPWDTFSEFPGFGTS